MQNRSPIDSGSIFRDAVSSKPLDQVKLRLQTCELARNVLFVKPLPFLDRVIFISMPRRGSYLAGPQIVHRLAARLIAEMRAIDRVHTHSTIAVPGDGPIESGSAGVVKYSSAHIEGVECELIVGSGHSAQSNPHTVQKVEQILRLRETGPSCGH